MECNGKPVVSFDLKPMHSFDLWGVIVDKHVLGKWKIQTYEELAQKEKIPKDTVRRVVREYRNLLDGEPWATGPRKSEIIDAIDGPALAHGIRPHYASAFMKDALCAMRKILDAGQKLMIFTSKPAPELGEQLAASHGEKMVEIRWGDKSNPHSFKEVCQKETRLGNRVVTHTADELPELMAARKSGLFHENGLIYVNRNNCNSKDRVTEEGIHCYVDDLRDVKYSSLVLNL